MTFYGYKRPDGRVGVRNKVLILPASLCASDTARIISQQVVGTVTFHNQQGCAQVAPDQQLTMDVMAGYAANPNIYGTVVVSLGCENCQMDLVVKAIQERTNKPIKEVIIQEVGGTLKAVDMGVRYAKEMVAEASMLQKEEFPISELIIGTECGGSDPTSGLAANPVIGEMSDRIVAAGGTSILSETTEFIGAEHILARRAATPEVHDRIFEIVHRYEAALRLVGEEVRDGNPSPGNKAGGITTLEEKSLGCIHKGGHSPINAVYDYAKQVESKQGLVILEYLERSLLGSQCLILGYGRIGKLVSCRLAALGAQTTIAARRPESRAWAEAYGHKALDIGHLKGELNHFDVVVNTVPAPVFGEMHLRELKPGCLCVDVASVRGIDLPAAENLGLPNVWARALPGKLMPETAGKIIRDTVYTIIKEQGVTL